jgi:hypothetical protein
MFRFNRTIIGYTTNVLKFLNVSKKKKVPDDGSDEPKHVAHFSMALKCVCDVKLCISKRILLCCLASVRFYSDLH